MGKRHKITVLTEENSDFFLIHEMLLIKIIHLFMKI